MSSVVQPITILEATVASRGRVTLPREVGMQLDSQKGSRVRFSIAVGGAVTIAPVPFELEDLWRLADSECRPKRAMSFAAMNKGRVRHES